MPAAVYMVLSSEWAGDKIRDIATAELTKLLGTSVNIGHVRVLPFSRVMIYDVYVDDDYGCKAISADNIEARFELYHFFETGHPAFDFGIINGLDINIYKKTLDSPLNIAGIIERLSRKEPDKEPTRFDISLYNIQLRNASVSYNVLSEPQKTNSFDASHIKLTDVDIIATAPKISNENFEITLSHFSFTEKSGFNLKDLTAKVKLNNRILDISDLTLKLPTSVLAFGPVKLDLNNQNPIKDNDLDFTLMSGSYINPSDLKSFVPALNDFNEKFEITAIVKTRKSTENINAQVNLTDNNKLNTRINADLKGPLKKDSIFINSLDINAQIKPALVSSVAHIIRNDNVSRLIGKTIALGNIRLDMSASGCLSNLFTVIDLTTDKGAVEAKTHISCDNDFRRLSLNTDADLKALDLESIFPDINIKNLTGNISGEANMLFGKLMNCELGLNAVSFDYRGNPFNELTTDICFNTDRTFTIDLKSKVGEDGSIKAFLAGLFDKRTPRLDGIVELNNIRPYNLGITKSYEGYSLSTVAKINASVNDNNKIEGNAGLYNTKFISDNTENPNLIVNKFAVSANNAIRPNVINIDSDFLNGNFEGEFNFFTLSNQICSILNPSIPTLIKKVYEKTADENYNDFRFSLELSNAENIVSFLKLPLAVIYPVNIEGSMNYKDGLLTFGVDAPYLMKGDMIIEQTTLEGKFDVDKGGLVYLTTQFPTKKGMMVISGGISVLDDLFRSHLDWEIQRDKPIRGLLAFDTKLSRAEVNKDLNIQVDFEPSSIEFGNDIWNFAPATIRYSPGILDIDHFALATQTQSIKINGRCEASDPMSNVEIELNKVILNTIFETLDINKALLGGEASGTLYAGGIFSSTPFVTCDNLFVRNIGYNNCVLGDGDIIARWNNDRKSFYLNAVITQEDGRKSYVEGDIFPGTESLDISFKADKIKVGFMRPFMDAFAEDVSGYASGRARIFGNFKYIDMEGDVYADNLGLKVGFTNTWYFASDSIHIVPGLIDIKNVTVRDSEGHEAELNGVVKHNFFKDPVFDFRVTDAHDFLCYDVGPSLSPDWYGKIYGNGSAFITGSPGVVNIDVNMTTADNSTFTFVLSDTEEAEQYNFLTFRDKNRNIITDTIIQKDIMPQAVIDYRDKIRRQALAMNPPSTYNMNIQMDITPAAKVIIVMDPIGGDEIKSWGRGNMRMTYTSVGNELRMYGTYAIERGSYNFTLQDIIVKDFVIREGSSITFTGDPYNASLDITASYIVNANLSDLDESFLNDPELNRTNVPVHALLIVKGDMRQPDINFDLEFPTLNSDIYRKVRSIISTEEMMNRQMIYLLALNRFYTPEYMSATKGNELFSVASSTLSSRLSSMLGKLSENWTIAPNLRSDKGDFSDVQFDVALSSNLLNNRLRLNGNFGYRDKSLNTTQFIGDFDLEYLINRAGTWRLKAYNRFNDQTYFLRTAKTTQGVGIKFQREFDNMFGFLRKNKTENKASNDTIPATNE